MVGNVRTRKFIGNDARGENQGAKFLLVLCKKGKGSDGGREENRSEIWPIAIEQRRRRANKSFKRTPNTPRLAANACGILSQQAAPRSVPLN